MGRINVTSRIFAGHLPQHRVGFVVMMIASILGFCISHRKLCRWESDFAQKACIAAAAQLVP